MAQPDPQQGQPGSQGQAGPPPPQQGQGGGITIQFPPGHQPTPEQIRHIQQQIAAEAQKAGLTVQQYVEKMKEQMMRQQQLQAQQQGQGQPRPGQAPPQQGQGAQPGQQEVIQQGNPPTPESLALANFLRSQDLKPRTCILQEKRKDMFKVKRAIRALHSEAYQKARKKNPLLPEVNDRVTAENTFKLLPRSFLALRVSKIDPHEGHDHAKKKRVKGLWTVKIEPQQEASDDFYYVWLYEGSQWKNKLYAVGALVGILAVVFFPVWPYHLRLGVWYLSMGALGLLGLFFAIAIVRLILFLVTMFAAPPGLWLYPNLFEDVGFFDSFKPVWAWHEDELAIKKRKKEEKQRKHARREAKALEKAGKGGAAGKTEAPAAASEPQPVQGTVQQGAAANTTATESPAPKASAIQRNLSATVEEEDD